MIGVRSLQQLQLCAECGAIVKCSLWVTHVLKSKNGQNTFRRTTQPWAKFASPPFAPEEEATGSLQPDKVSRCKEYVHLHLRGLVKQAIKQNSKLSFHKVHQVLRAMM
jgi:hypothetical protein